MSQKIKITRKNKSTNLNKNLFKQERKIKDAFPCLIVEKEVYLYCNHNRKYPSISPKN